MQPFLGGGDMIASVGFDSSTWNDLPWKFEAGTSPIAEGVGLGAAVDYLSAIGMDAVRAHERELTAYTLERLEDVEGLHAFGPIDPDLRGGVVSLELKGVHPHDLAEICDREHVCIRAGHHCAQPLMREMGVPATARASFHVYNDRDDVDRLIAALQTALVVDDAGKIVDLRFHGHGCAISQASASIASEELIGMQADEVAALGADWVIDLLGIEISPTRRKCALLSLKVMRGAVTGDASWPE
jgi:hypothetical protein